jgi:predicted Ser/Thr protein kinase
MAVFFVRRAVVDNGLRKEICRIIESAGFEVLQSIDLEGDQIDAAASLARGGNWGPGAFHVSGGPPAQLLIAFDVLPAPVRKEHLVKYPHLDNGHILEAKLRCREFIAARLPPRRRFNPVHSTDASADAWDVIQTFAPEEEAPLRETIKSRKAGFVTSFEVIRDLTRTGLRSKIELINYGGEIAVKKTFRDNCLRFLKREASFMEEISPLRPEIPPVLERGPNFLVMPFLEGHPLRRFVLGRGVPRLMTLKQVRQVSNLLRFLFSRGYDPVDLGPHNLLVDRSGRLYAIDFEFVHRTGAPVDPELSACLSGVRQGYEGEWPAKALYSPKRAKCLDPWRHRWSGCTGLSIRSFLYDPPAVQWAKRMVNYPTYLGSKIAKHQALWLAQGTKRGLRKRMPAVTRIVTNAFRSKALRSRSTHTHNMPPPL